MIRNYVLIDIDNQRYKTKVLERCWNIFHIMLPGRKIDVEVHRSPSGKGLHIIASFLTKKPMDSWYILLIQCLCGSDIRREICNAKRIAGKVKIWNVLFCTKRVHL